MPDFPVNPGTWQALEARLARVGVFERDLEEAFVRSGGAGGQNVNKVSSCVILTHRPSGTTVRCQEERSQALNRFLARKRLAERMEQKILGAASEKQRAIERIRRQKRRRGRRAKEKMLAAKHHTAGKEAKSPPARLQRLMLSVLIPAYNEAALLPRTLSCLRAGLSAAGIIDWELVVCDNNSADDTARIAREAGARVVFEGHNQISRARNRAAMEAKGEWLLFLDADTQASPELLAAMAEKIRQGVCGGGALVAFDAPVGALGRLGVAFWNRLSRAFSWAAGCFIFCRREAWAAVGGFDEKLYASEEIGFSMRLGRWGKGQGRRFVIIDGPRAVSSARKFTMFSALQMGGMFLVLAVPGALRVRRFCRLWYDRPPRRPEPGETPGAGEDSA